MKVDFNTTLLTIYNSPILETAPDPEDPTKMNTKSPVTLRSVSVNSLLKDEPNASGKIKLTRYLLAKRIHESNGDEEISVKEAALLQKLIGKTYNPLVVGQALPLLEGS